MIPAPNVDNSYSFICEQCNKDSPTGQSSFEHRSKTWYARTSVSLFRLRISKTNTQSRLELVATATYNTARLAHSQYVKVGDIVQYLEEHQQKLNLNLCKVDKCMSPPLPSLLFCFIIIFVFFFSLFALLFFLSLFSFPLKYLP